MDNRYKKLAKNTIIFAIGGFGSKILSFFIVPLYSFLLTTEEYGQLDLLNTTVSVLIPFTTLIIQDAALRFLVGGEIDQKTAASNCFLVFLGGVGLTVLLYPSYHIILRSDRFVPAMLVMTILSSFNRIFGQYLRAINKNMAFALNGILSTVAHITLNLIFLLGFKWGMYGYLYAGILASAICAIHIFYEADLWKNVSFHSVNFRILKKMVFYSLPLIPNSLMWWIMSGGDKYIINHYLGDSANGLYAMAMKIPTIISMLFSLFYQSWQLSAIEENGKKGEKQFYEKIFTLVTVFLLIVTSGIILLVKPFYEIAMSQEFLDAWCYVPVLSLATVCSCYGSFFAVVYAKKKRTLEIFLTTGLGAVLNVLISFLLIKKLGLQGVAIGTLVGYLGVAVYRAVGAKLELKISFDAKRTIIAMGALILQTAITVCLQNVWIYVSGAAALLLYLILYRKEALEIRSIIIKMFIKKKNYKEG